MSLQDTGNFIIIIVSGAIIPLLLVLYKSRCKSICFGCIVRDVVPSQKKEKNNEENNIEENNIDNDIHERP